MKKIILSSLAVVAVMVPFVCLLQLFGTDLWPPAWLAAYWAERDPPRAKLMTGIIMENLGGDVDLYIFDTGVPPGTNTGLEALLTNPGVPEWHGPYLRPAVLRKDSWGTLFRYRLAGSNYVIQSAGPDRRFDTPDDICRTGRVSRAS